MEYFYHGDFEKLINVALFTCPLGGFLFSTTTTHAGSTREENKVTFA